jgi:hypothetical protein
MYMRRPPLERCAAGIATVQRYGTESLGDRKTA